MEPAYYKVKDPYIRHILGVPYIQGMEEVITCDGESITPILTNDHNYIDRPIVTGNFQVGLDTHNNQLRLARHGLMVWDHWDLPHLARDYGELVYLYNGCKYGFVVPGTWNLIRFPITHDQIKRVSRIPIDLDNPLQTLELVKVILNEGL